METYRSTRRKPWKRNRLKQWRIHKGLLQKEMAEKLPISLTTYMAMENNRRLIEPEIERILAKLLDISIYQLYENDDY